jgi:hypothetical protein
MTIHSSLMSYRKLVTATLLTLLIAAVPVLAQTTAFTYQGQLNDAGSGVEAERAQIVFKLWDAETGGDQVVADYIADEVEIIGGIFTTQVDFGDGIFGRGDFWLEIGVDPEGGTSYTWLAPRQPLTPAPTAVYALHGGDNPWRISGDNLSYSDGNVGLGTTTPATMLDIYGFGEDPLLTILSYDNQNDTAIGILSEIEVKGSAIKGLATATSSDAWGVYGESRSSEGIGVRGYSGHTTGAVTGVHGQSRSSAGTGVYGYNSASSGNGIGVKGRANSATGFGGYFEGQGYFSGRVGIGTESPDYDLHVSGTVKADDIRLSAGAQSGYVLTSDASGAATWEPAATGSGYWVGNGSDIYFDSGQVGIGTNAPEDPLHVYLDDTGPAIQGENDNYYGYGVLGKANHSTGSCIGVLGQSWSASGSGVKGYNGNQTGSGKGVLGVSASPQGSGVFADNTAATGGGRAVFGRVTSPDGFGGYFMGKGYFSGDVGIGTTSPDAELEVDGTVKMTGLQLPSAAQNGYILTSDASGNATWQQPTGTGSSHWLDGTGDNIYYSAGNVGINTSDPLYDLHVTGSSYSTSLYGGSLNVDSFQMSSGASSGHVLTSNATGSATWQAPSTAEMELPFDGSVTSTSPAFKVTNSGTGNFANAVHGEISNSGATSSSAAGYFYAQNSNGCGVKAYAGGDGDGVYTRHNGTDGYALYAYTAEGLGAGYFERGASGGSTVHVKSTGNTGMGIEIESSGVTGTGLLVNTTGAESYGVTINSPWVGLVAKGAVAGARIYGHLDIYEFGTNNKVIELGKGLDYAEGFDITGGKSAACPGCVLAIDPAAPGQLTVCTTAYDTKVAGIVAGANGLGSGIRLGANEFDHDVALAGRVYCNVIALDNDIQPGDMLTTSNIAGYAMEVQDPIRAQGAVLGKAMEPLVKGQKGQILVLVTLQ